MAALARRHFFIAGCVAVFAAGVIGGVWTYQRAEQRGLADLMANAQRCAVVFQGGSLQALTGTPADAGTPTYEWVKERLVDLRRVQPGVRFVYIFRPQPGTGKVVFLADSEPVTSKDISLPGDEFPEAAESPGLQSIIATGRPATEGPLRDEFGIWITGYAPVKNPAGAAMSPPDIVGLDIAAGTWRAQLYEEAFRTALYVWLLFGLPLVMQLILRRWSAQERTIRKWSEAVEQSRSAMMITGMDSGIDYVNQGLCDQIGYSREELIGRNWNDFRVEETPVAVLAVMVSTVRAGRAWEGEWVNRRKSGELYPVSGVISPVLDRKGAIICFIATLRDMTESKRVEAELRKAKERAELGARAKGEFLDTMSHELRTPLNGIVGFTSLLLDTPLMPEQREYVQTVRSSGEALLRLTGDILDYSRMESRPPPLDPQPCDVRGLLEEVFDLLAGMAAEKGLALLHQVAPEVPAIMTVDAGRLRQVLVNLVGNAVKFTQAGEVEVRVRARAGTTTGEGTTLKPGQVWLDFSVRDTGPGIGEDDQKRLFQPFTQLDGSIHRRHGGAGLGLAISRSLVQLMGGGITLRSEAGRGSVFRFAVPAESGAARVESLALAGRRVAVAVRLPGLLRELFRVISAAGGVPVACRLEELTPAVAELAVVDCDQGVMARMHEAALDFAEWPKGTVIGLVTSALAADDRRQLRELFHTLLSKPLHHDTLVETLALGRRATAAQPKFDLRVLIVDDNAVNLRLLQGMTTALGCRSVALTGGRAAIDALAKDGRFDLVMLDLRMPDLDGLEVLRRVRAGEAGEAARGVWITIVTADAQTEVRDELVALGCNDFVPKPITLASVIAALTRARAPGRKEG